MTPSPLKSSPARTRRLSRKLGATLTELINEGTWKGAPSHRQMDNLTGWTAKHELELMSGAATWDINDIHAAARLFGISASEFLEWAGL